VLVATCGDWRHNVEQILHKGDHEIETERQVFFEWPLTYVSPTRFGSLQILKSLWTTFPLKFNHNHLNLFEKMLSKELCFFVSLVFFQCFPTFIVFPYLIHRGLAAPQDG